jgi:hypothetical protein
MTAPYSGHQRRYQEITSERRVALWLEDVARGSVITADVNRRRIGWFSERHGLLPGDLLALDQESLHDLLLGTVGDLERAGHAGSYAQSIVTAVRSWLAFNGVALSRKIKIRGVSDTPTLTNERVPTQPELKAIFEAANVKTRSICALLSQCGLRPEVLGNYYGTDGLRLSDLPDLEQKGRWWGFARVPAMVIVRPSLSKKAHQYFTFLSAEGCEALKQYLNRRAKHGERLGPDSPVITPPIAAKPFIRTTNISDAARLAIRKAGFPWRPYTLRSYFATQMMLAESRGLMLRDYRVFFMGHLGDIESVYTLRKRSLPEEVVDEMRAAYVRAQGLLEPSAEQPPVIRVSAPSSPRVRQQVAPVAELDEWMAKGWLFLALLPDNRVVLQREGKG